VRKNAFCESGFSDKNDHFTETGSGLTEGKVETKRVLCRTVLEEKRYLEDTIIGGMSVGGGARHLLFVIPGAV
jgi:hypothetical protein